MGADLRWDRWRDGAELMVLEEREVEMTDLRWSWGRGGEELWDLLRGYGAEFKLWLIT